MSYYEYSDMFERAQKRKSEYVMIIVDVCNSKTNPQYPVEKNLVIELMRELTQKLPLNIITNNEILFKTKDKFFIFGDLFGITITTDKAIEQVTETFLCIFNELKQKYKITLDFHINSGYYETDEYTKGNKLYYSGYCVQELEKRSK